MRLQGRKTMLQRRVRQKRRKPNKPAEQQGSNTTSFLNIYFGAREMVQQLSEQAALPEDLGSVSSKHMTVHNHLPTPVLGDPTHFSGLQGSHQTHVWHTDINAGKTPT